MLRRLKFFDPGLAVTLLLAAFAAWAFITRSSLPTFTDAEHHVYRTYEIISAWKQGVPYLRWAPDLFLGYGYPIFNYYAPLTYYLGAAYGLLCACQEGAVAGVKFVFVLSACLGAVGMYLFVRDQWGGVAGVVSAAAYGLSPYSVYVNPHMRGALPETFSIALAPFLLWAFARLIRTTSVGSRVVAVLAVAALILSHNLMSLVLIGMLVTWLGWEMVGEMAAVDAGDRAATGAARGRMILLIGVTLLLGVGLAAFMWLPASLERGAVQFQRAFVLPSYGLRFVGAEELFSPASLADVVKPEAFQWRFRLGIAQWALGGLGALTVFVSRPRRRTTLFFALAATACIFLMLPVSSPIWQRSPLVYLQLPWRLLGPAAVALGVLTGAAVNWANDWSWAWGRAALGLAAVTACLAAAMPLMDPPHWADFGPVNPKRMFMVERTGDWGVGTTQQAEFLPVGVVSVPAAQEALFQSYENGLVDKIDRARLPEGTQVTVVEHGPELDRYQVTSQTGFVLHIFTFYFPGWTAYLDGIKTGIGVQEPEGLMTVSLPAGTHEVLLRFENTPPRWLGWIVSGLAGLELLWFARLRLNLHFTSPCLPEILRWRYGLALIPVVLAAMGARYLADQSSWWYVRSSSYEVPGAQQQRFVRLENNIALLAFDLPQAEAKPGGQVPLTLYWQALAPVPINLSVFVHFFGPDGKLWGQSDKLNPAGGLPTNRWPLGDYMPDSHLAPLQPDAPPGMYTVRAGLWDRYTGIRLRVLDANGLVTDMDGVVLTTTFKVQP